VAAAFIRVMSHCCWVSISLSQSSHSANQLLITTPLGGLSNHHPRHLQVAGQQTQIMEISQQPVRLGESRITGLQQTQV
jgi:hypothetical protein